MSTEIDSKVVEMRFDNKQFEANVATSMSTIEKLKQSLNLTGASKGLENVSDAAKNCNVSSIGTAVETIQARFSSFEVAAVTALANITNSAVNCGKRMVAALTIDSKKQGFEEYELKMNSIQTIMMSTGASLEDVNKYLNELNTYADRTIYSFSDMTSNIGKFTNAGVKLEDAVMAIQGVSNAAAVSGANSNEASRAMYNFAQALSAGYVKLIDWKSIENANMATVEFKTQLLESAVACGTLTKTADGMYKVLSTNAAGKKMDEAIDATHNFNDSLAYQWMTTEALVGTLRDYADETTEIGKKAFAAAQDVKTFTQLWDTLKEAAGSGWAMTWEILIGDFEEAKATLTEVSNVMGNIIGESANARNELLQGWKDLGGRTVLLESFKNIFDAILSVVKPIKEAFRDIFPATTAQQLLSFTEGFRNLTSHLILSDSAAENLKNVFKGLFSVVKVIVNILSSFVQGATKLVGAILPVGDGVLSVSGSLGEFVSKINEAISGTNIFGAIFETLANIITPTAELIKNALNGIATGVDKLGGLTGVLKKVASGISTVFDKIKTVVSNAMGNLGFDSLLDAVNGGLLAGILLGIKKFIKSLTDLTTNGPGIVNGIKDILDGVSGSLEAFQSQIKAGTLLKIASALGILAASLVVLSTIDEGKMTSSLAAITGLFVDLFASMAVFEKIMGGSGFKAMGKVSRAMINLSLAVLVLSAAMKNIAGLKWSEIAKGITGVAALSAVLVASASLMSKSSGQLTKSAVGLIAFSTAIVILTNAVESLGNLDIASLTKGLVGVGVLLAELAIFLNNTDLDGMGMFKGVGILAMAAGISVLSDAVGKLAAIDIGGLAKGLGSIAVLLTELTLFMKFNGDAKGIISTATGMTILGAAMLIFANAISQMGNLSWGEIAKGLVAMAGALAAVTLSMNLLPDGMMSKSVAMVGIASALVILSNALNSMGGMSWGEIAKGLVTLASSLTIIAVAMQFMTSALAGAAALLVVSAALAVLTPVLLALGSMSWEGIAKGLVSIAGAFAIIGVAGLLLGPISPLILALGGAVALLGAGCLAAGVGLLAFSTALSALAISGTAGGAALVAVIQSLIALIPSLAVAIGAGIVAMAATIGANAVTVITAFTQILTAMLQAIIDVAPKLAETIVTVLTSLLDAVIEVTPKFAEAVATILASILDVIAETVPKIVETVVTCLEAVLQGIVEFVPQMVVAGLQIITGLLQGIADNIGGVVEAGVNIIVNFLEAIGNELPRVVDAGFNMMINFINGLADSINTNTPILTAAINNLMNAVINAAITLITGSIGNFLNAGSNVFGGFINGLKSKVSSVYSTVTSMVSNTVSKIKGKVSEFTSAGANLINGFINGIKNKISEAAQWAANLAKSALDAAKNALGIHSPSRAFIAIGSYIGEGLAQGIRDATWQAVNASEEMANRVASVASKSFEDAEKWVEDAKYFNELSLAEELEIWEAMIGKYAEGTEERTKAEKKAYKVYEELRKNDYQDSMDWIEQEKYYNRLSLYDELAAYKRVQSRYAQGTDEYKKMAKEIYRVQNEINEANENFYKESLRIQEEYEEKKEALEEEHKNKVKEINEQLEADIQAANDAYDEAVKSRTQTLYDAYGLFDKVEAQSEVSGSELFENLQSQVDAFTDWKKDINELADKGINAKLLEELQEMGPSSAAQIKALNKLSTHELNDYVSLWQEKYDLANEQAILELEDTREETKSQIAKLRYDAKLELEEYEEMWNEEMEDLRDDTNKQLEELREDWMDTIGSLKDDTKSEFTEMTEEISNIVGEKNDWTELGSNIVEGIMMGIINAEGDLLAAVQQVMANMKSTAADSVDSHSPSRDFAKLGKYCMQGLAQGIENCSKDVMDATQDVGEATLSTMSKSIARVSDFINNGIDSEPTIKPILDLSNIQNGVRTVNGIFSGRTLSLGMSIGNSMQSGNNDQYGGLKDATVSSNDKIVDAIGTLRNDISTLADVMRNMKLVMDTGALVGAITPEMDKSLGKIAAYSKRGM